jgi:hypothetical protein
VLGSRATREYEQNETEVNCYYFGVVAVPSIHVEIKARNIQTRIRTKQNRKLASDRRTFRPEYPFAIFATAY